MWLDNMLSIITFLMCICFELQVAFVLYPPSGSPEWNLSDIENKMFLTMCFCWHYASIFVITGLNYALITW